MNGLSLCAGVGGMDLGLQLAIGRDYRTVGYVEREAFAASTLVARMEDEALDQAHIWDDLATFDGKPFYGLVDIVSSGLPCQPYSVAGSQRGHADERALWPEFVRIVEECQPGIVFIENVPAFRRHFEPVWRELRGLGFKWAPPLLSTASESGAPHIRERFFALAAHPERIKLRVQPGRVGGKSRPGQAEPSNSSEPHPDSREPGLERRCVRGRECAHERTAGEMGHSPADANVQGLKGEWCGWVFDGERETIRHNPDRCDNGCRTRGTIWDSESPPVRMAARTAHWMDELRAIGNVGAPPVVYARAFLTLARRLGEG